MTDVRGPAVPAVSRPAAEAIRLGAGSSIAQRKINRLRQALSKGMLSAAAVTSILSLSGAHAFADSEADGHAQDSPGVVSGNAVQAPLDVPVNVCGNTADVIAGLNPAYGNECENVSDHRESRPHHKKSSHEGKPPRHHEEQHHAKPEAEREAKPEQHAPQRPHQEPRPHHEGSSDSSAVIAEGDAVGSPGVASGNNAKAPVDAPIQACGNHLGIVSLLSSVFGNGCDAPASEPGKGYGEDGEGETPHEPEPHEPEPHGPGTGHKTVPDGPVEVSSPTPWAPRHTPQTTREDEPVDTRAQLAETGADEVLYGVSALSAALLLGGAVLYRRRAVSSAAE